MEYNEIYKVINENNGKKFSITYTNGNKEVRRLFISTCNDICEFIPKSRTRGNVVTLSNVLTIMPFTSKVTPIQRCRKNLNNVIKYLTASGFWTPMLNGAKYLLSLSDEELLAMRDWGYYHKVMNDDLYNKNIHWFGGDCFSNMFIRNIKTMNFDKYDREYQKQNLKNNIINRTDCHHKWVNGYDNSYEIRFHDDYTRAWYSEEFRNCANGHYYFLLDETHVLFGEDD